MRDLSETAISVLFAFCGLAITYWLLGEWLSAFILRSFDQVRP
jgi:hypothetical protein